MRVTAYTLRCWPEAPVSYQLSQYGTLINKELHKHDTNGWFQLGQHNLLKRTAMGNFISG